MNQHQNIRLLFRRQSDKTNLEYHDDTNSSMLCYYPSNHFDKEVVFIITDQCLNNIFL